MEFSLSEVEQALAKLHRIAPDKRSNFAGRLKHYQRNGFPPGTNTGRGRAAAYRPEHLFMMGMALELNQFGASPERAMRQVLSNVTNMAETVKAVTRSRYIQALPNIMCVVPAMALAELAEGDSWEEDMMFMPSKELGSVARRIGTAAGPVRIAAMSLTGLLDRLCGAVMKTEELDERYEFFLGLIRWAKGVLGDTSKPELFGGDT